jgi:hypothetical protein
MIGQATSWEFLVPFERWTEPRIAGLRLSCSLNRTSDPTEAARIWGRLPDELLGFWSVYRDGHLFQDIDYGQWGLHLFTPSEAKTQTTRYLRLKEKLRAGDIVVAEFLGDSDLVVVDENGRTLIAAPIDPRTQWHAWNNFHQFMRDYVNHDGEKHWEAAHGRK